MPSIKQPTKKKSTKQNDLDDALLDEHIARADEARSSTVFADSVPSTRSREVSSCDPFELYHQATQEYHAHRDDAALQLLDTVIAMKAHPSVRAGAFYTKGDIMSRKDNMIAVDCFQKAIKCDACMWNANLCLACEILRSDDEQRFQKAHDVIQGAIDRVRSAFIKSTRDRKLLLLIFIREQAHLVAEGGLDRDTVPLDEAFQLLKQFPNHIRSHQDIAHFLSCGRLPRESHNKALSIVDEALTVCEKDAFRAFDLESVLLRVSPRDPLTPDPISCSLRTTKGHLLLLLDRPREAHQLLGDIKSCFSTETQAASFYAARDFHSVIKVTTLFLEDMPKPTKSSDESTETVSLMNILTFDVEARIILRTGFSDIAKHVELFWLTADGITRFSSQHGVASYRSLCARMPMLHIEGSNCDAWNLLAVGNVTKAVCRMYESLYSTALDSLPPISMSTFDH